MADGDMSGANLILQERMRQITHEGHTAEGDNTFTGMELLQAALCYGAVVANPKHYRHRCSAAWPWSLADWKPTFDPIRDLVKAGALIAAEIDRLQRLREAARGNPPAGEGQQ